MVVGEEWILTYMYEVKEIFFWNKDEDRPFAHADREEGWEKFKDVAEYFKIRC